MTNVVHRDLDPVAERVDAVRVVLVTEDGGAERLVRLGAQAMTIGRDSSAGIRVESPFVSRLHARIEPQPDGPLLVDLGSHNGTLVNGQHVAAPVALRVGDVVEIANVRLLCLAVAPERGATRTYVRPAAAQSFLSAGPPGEGGVRARVEGMIRVDERTREVWIDGHQPERRLSAQEFALLAYLSAHRDRVCTRQELGDTIWGRDRWDANMLHQLARRLKEKIEPDPAQPRFIRTVPQAGYRLSS